VSQRMDSLETEADFNIWQDVIRAQVPLASKVGSLAMLLAMRRASSAVSTFTMCASSGVSRE
jgi:hypothetical protein